MPANSAWPFGACSARNACTDASAAGSVLTVPCAGLLQKVGLKRAQVGDVVGLVGLVEDVREGVDAVLASSARIWIGVGTSTPFSGCVATRQLSPSAASATAARSSAHASRW